MVGEFTEHWGRRLFAAIGGALVSAFGPSVVPDKYEPWLVALGLIIILGALFWPALERWPGQLLKEHVAWRFRLRPPAIGLGESQFGAIPETALPAGAAGDAKAEARRLLSTLTAGQRERTAVALTEIRDFLRNEFEPFIRNRDINNWQQIMREGGPRPLQYGLEMFQRTVAPMAGELGHLRRKHEFELDLVEIDLIPLIDRTAHLDAPPMIAARVLPKIGAELRDPEVIEATMEKVTLALNEARIMSEAVFDEVETKRMNLELAEKYA